MRHWIPILKADLQEPDTNPPLAEEAAVLKRLHKGKKVSLCFQALFLFLRQSDHQALVGALLGAISLKCQPTQQVRRFGIWHQSIIRPAPAADGASSVTSGLSNREAY